MRAITHGVAGAEDLVRPEDLQVGPGQFQGEGIAVDVGNQPDFHGSIASAFLGRQFQVVREAISASSADRFAAASTASITEARNPPRSRA